MEIILACKNLEVRYGHRIAIKDLSFELQRGQSLALIGQNGAGKTSTLKAVIGYLPLKSGQIQILGRKSGDWRIFTDIGFAPETAHPPEALRAAEYLGFIARLKGATKKESFLIVEELISVFELEPHKKIGDYSKGMTRRLILAQAFVKKPALVILDEPLNGLDPLMIIRLRDWINRCRAEGLTFIYSSHILSEIEKSCDRLLLVHEGKCLLEGPLDQIKKDFGSVEQAFYQTVGNP